MSDEIKTIEIVDEKSAEVKAETPVTREDLKEKGWTAQELESAEKRGMIPKPDEKPTEVEKEEKKVDILPVPEEKKDPPNFLDVMDGEMSPDQEKYFLEKFPAGTKPRAFYFRAKNERLARQKAEAERDRLALEVQMFKDKNLRLEDRPQVETDENGNVIDPEDKPLTMKQLRAMQVAEQEKLNKQQEELTNRSVKASEALKTQEEYAKSIHPDFEETVKLAADLVNNLDQIPEKWKRDKVLKLLTELQVTAASADRYGVDDYNAPMISLEIGQLHPKYGQKAAPDGQKSDPKANGSLTPEQMKRIEENTQRRTSSASLPGSSNGRRVIAVEDITIKEVLKMSPEQRFKFKRDHSEKFAKLMRG